MRGRTRFESMRAHDPYAPGAKRPVADPKFFTTEQQDFYKSILLEQKPRVPPTIVFTPPAAPLTSVDA